ncbi:MAG: methionyl-tRNA formyltransferase [Terrimesophilobacter sp.]
MTSLRVLFAGSPAAAVPSLRALVSSKHELVSVVTREKSPHGRKRVLTATPIADVARELGLPVLEANRLPGAPTELITSLEPDLGVIVAYGGLIREPLLSVPKLGWINLHFSLLPRWRGAAPVQRAIMAGDDVTGACVFQLVEELDAGPVFGTLTQSIGGNETAGHLLDSLAVSGAQLLVRVVDMIAEGTARAEEQVGEVTRAPKLTIEDGQINWALTAELVDQNIRGVTPEPGAFTRVEDSRVKILQAHVARDVVRRPAGRIDCEAGRVLVGTASVPIELTRVQPAGKNPMNAADWWRGRQFDGEVRAQ